MLEFWLMLIGIILFLFGFFSGREIAAMKLQKELTELNASREFWKDVAIRNKAHNHPPPVPGGIK